MKSLKKATREQLDDFDGVCNSLFNFVKRTWDIKAKPKGYDEFVEDYIDFKGQEEFDSEKAEKMFKGFDNGNERSFPFPVKLGLPYVAYDDKCQGRSPLRVLIAACVTHGMVVEHERWEREKKKLEERGRELEDTITKVHTRKFDSMEDLDNFVEKEAVKIVDFGTRKQLSKKFKDDIKKSKIRDDMISELRAMLNPDELSAEEYAGCPRSDPNFMSCLEEGIAEVLGYEQTTRDSIYERADRLEILLPDEKEIAFPELVKKKTKQDEEGDPYESRLLCSEKKKAPQFGCLRRGCHGHYAVKKGVGVCTECGERVVMTPTGRMPTKWKQVGENIK